MKLCRFELKAEPGSVRSGIVYGGKVYETDGSTASAIHEADSIRPLSPTGQPPSLRIFRGPVGSEEVLFAYGNPNCLVGPSQTIEVPGHVALIDAEPYVGIVMGSDGQNIDEEQAESLVLGYTLVNFLVARDFERLERAAGFGLARSYDLGAAIGPVLTTPDELVDSAEEAGRSYRLNLEAVLKVNGVESRRGNASDAPYSIGAMVAAASEHCPIRAGDILCAGPIVEPSSGEVLSPGDEVTLSVEHLGTLAMRLA